MMQLHSYESTDKLSRYTYANDDPNDLKEQLCALTEGLRILTKIVTMDDSFSESLDYDRRIEELQSLWRLEDTGFSGLYNACKQMKESLCLTSRESDEALIEAQETRKTATAAKFAREKMKKKANAVLKENIELRNRNRILSVELKKEKKQKKIIAHSVRNFVDTFIKEQQVDTQNKSILTSTYYSPSPDESKDDDSGEDWEEVSNPPSGSSLVTGDGCPTVCFAQRKPKTTRFSRHSLKNINWKDIIPTSSVLSQDNELDPTPSVLSQDNELDLLFPSKKCGISFGTVSQNYPGKQESKAIVVFGFTEFDESLNQQPLFGSRLVSVDGISLESEKWEKEQFMDYMASKNGSMRMRFKNEFLTKKQIEQLKSSTSFGTSTSTGN